MILCPRTKKIAFVTPQAAHEKAVKLNRNNRQRHARKHSRVYFCQFCSTYHLTSSLHKKRKSEPLPSLEFEDEEMSFDAHSAKERLFDKFGVSASVQEIGAQTVKPSLPQIIGALLAKSKDGVISITPQLARHILDECNFSGQRPIRRPRVARHIRRIETGMWNADLSVITLARTPDGHLHNVNGQHRLTAIAECGVTVKSTMKVAAAKDEQEVRRFYASFDEPGSSRNDNEFLNGVGLSDTLDLSPQITSALFRAMPLLLNDLEPMGPRLDTAYARERDVRLDSIIGWKKEAAIYSGIVKRAEGWLRGRMLSQGAMATALFLLRHQPKRASEFWNGLAENDGLRRADPRARLIGDFRERNATFGNIRQGVQRVAVAWNAFYEGRDLTVIRCNVGGAITLKGTPKK